MLPGLILRLTLKSVFRIAQARTGTGKTLAFLIPVLQNIINYDPSLEKLGSRGKPRGSPTDIRAIIISPTRELAEQIAVEAKKLTKNTGVIVQTAVGGSAKQVGLRMIKNEGCHILVGTPGRLNDILSDPYSQVRAPNLSAFVLDEADRLLDQGFAPEIEAIQKLLPDRRDLDRQTLLFSATVPREVMQIVRKIMKPDFKFVRTVQEGEQQTHDKVPQKLVNVGGFENLMPALLELCKREIAAERKTPFKALVYFGATADVTLAHSTFANLRNPGSSLYHKHPLHPAKVMSIHAKLTQQARTRAADNFRRAESAIMLSSDVTARGMDFPGVTHVIQMGIPSSRDTYIHRIGRTARGDKEGEGWLFVTDVEAKEVGYRLTKLPLVRDASLQTAKVDMTKDAQLPEDTAKILTQVVEAAKMTQRSEKVASYLAALGVYAWAPNKQQLVDSMNNRAKYGWGMETPPAVARGLAQKLGLSRVSGIVIGHNEYDEQDDRTPRSGGFGSSRGNFAIGGAGGRGGFDRGGRGGGFSRGGGGGGGGFSRGGFSRGGDREGGFSRGGDRQGGFSRGGERDGGFSRGGFGRGGRDGGDQGSGRSFDRGDRVSGFSRDDGGSSGSRAYERSPYVRE